MILKVRRVELKYTISQQEMFFLRSRLAPVMKRDAHSKAGAYLVRSLYFDSKSDRSYLEKEGGFEDRMKYRLRIYDFERRLVKFEIKHKVGDIIQKHTATMSGEHADRMLRGDIDGLLSYRDPVLNRAYYEFKRDYYRPVVIVQYDREAYELGYNHIRVTFDTRLRASSRVEEFFNPDLLLAPAVLDTFPVMEVKYDHFFPRWLDDVLIEGRRLRTANSKYCLSRQLMSSRI